MGLTLLLGGARSGKSSLAVRMASRYDGSVAFVATAEGLDPEMAARIERHRAERPPSWEVVEEPVDLVSALGKVPDDACALVDCLTLWVSNLMGNGCDEAEIAQRAEAAARVAAARRAPTIAVSNEVGSGIVPVNDLARTYRDVMGRVNAIWAEAAGRTLLVVAGRVLELSDSSAIEIEAR